MIHFENTNGFPLTTDILEQMQKDYNIYNQAFKGIVDNTNFTIIEGCQEITQFGGGTKVSNGVVMYNDEIMPFIGGIVAPNLKVFSVYEVISDNFEDGGNHPVITKKYATLGLDFGEGYSWDTVKNNRINIVNQDVINDLLSKINKLEEKLNKTLPIGTVALWGKPAQDIPSGWVEYTPLRGKMPIGHDGNYAQMPAEPINYHLNKLGHEGGERMNMLQEGNIPHTVVPGNKRSITFNNNGGTSACLLHNNMPPYRVVQFIEFVGFDN